MQSKDEALVEEEQEFKAKLSAEERKAYEAGTPKERAFLRWFVKQPRNVRRRIAKQARKTLAEAGR